jgi:STE24 endopeptidase
VSERTGPGDDQRAVDYARAKEWLAVAEMVVNLALLSAALFSRSSARLRDVSERVSPRFAVSVFAALGTVLTSLLSLPLTFYDGYVVERRFGLSNQSLWGWLSDWLKGLALGTLLGAPLIQASYWVIRRWPRQWWAVLSALLIPFSVLLANLAPVLIMPLFNKFEPIPDTELEERIKRLASDQGVNVSRVLQMNMSKQTKKANAFFTGVGNTKRIVLGDTLLDEFNRDEVEVVLAHELGHQVHRDLWKLIALQLPLTLGSFFAMYKLASPTLRRMSGAWEIRAEEGIEDPASLPLLGLIASSFSLLAGPAVNAVIRRAVEHPADAYALEVTKNPGAFIDAMEKLGRMNLSDPDPPRLVKWLFHNHPTLRERIDFARRFGAAGQD